MLLRYLASVDPSWCDDKPLILLLIGCILFTSTRDGVTDLPPVKYFEEAYRSTLARSVRW